MSFVVGHRTPPPLRVHYSPKDTHGVPSPDVVFTDRSYRPSCCAIEEAMPVQLLRTTYASQQLSPLMSTQSSPSSMHSQLGEQLVIAPSSGVHNATVIFLHGLGQRAEDWTSLIRILTERHPNVKWILPQAPTMPVTMNDGRERPAWFDVFHLPPCSSCGVPGSAESIARIEQIILAELHTLNQPRKVIVAGFSQGAALSMLLALTTLHDLGGVASLSGWIPHKSRQQMAQFEQNLPVFWGHGTTDEEIPLEMGNECIRFLTRGLRFGDDRVTMKTYTGLTHAVCEQEIRDLSVWLTRVLA